MFRATGAGTCGACANVGTAAAAADADTHCGVFAGAVIAAHAVAGLIGSVLPGPAASLAMANVRCGGMCMGLEGGREGGWKVDGAVDVGQKELLRADQSQQSSPSSSQGGGMSPVA